MKNLLRVVLIISCCSLLTACTLFDRTAPEVSLKQEDTIQIEVNTDFDFDKYIIATDNRIEPNEITLETTLDSSILGEQEISVSATDTKENTSTIEFTVNVVDTTPPKITLNGNEEITVAHGSIFNDEGATVIDNFDTNCNIQTTGAVDTNTLGQYELNYTCIDSSQNESTITRLVHVADLTGPIINVGEKEIYEIKLGEVLPMDFGVAYDEIDGYVDTTVTGDLNYLSSGEYSLTFTAEDSSGNSTSINRIICIDPWTIESSNGMNTSIISFDLTDTGMFQMENTALSIEVVYENTTDKQIQCVPDFIFKNDGKSILKLNHSVTLAYSIDSFDANKTSNDYIDIAYQGDPEILYTSEEMQFEMGPAYYKTSLENKFDFCLRDLSDACFTEGYIIKDIFLDDESTSDSK